MSEASRFLFVGCQSGAERVLKEAVARQWPDFRLAFSRRGFVTFKLPDDAAFDASFDPQLVFARAHGLTLGKATGVTADECAGKVRAMLEDQADAQLHVWPRMVGESWQEATAAATRALTAVGLHASLPSAIANAAAPTPVRVIDVILVEPTEWWLGEHVALTPHLHWPGGYFPLELPSHAVSRAYLKMAEAIAWSQIPLAAGDHVAEIGCAPGGASQALLDRSLHVMGIDPAEVDPVVLSDPRFVYVRKRGHEVRRREFRQVRWLTADMNVAPQYTLDTVEAIVTHADVNIRGLILTLKLLDWSLARELPDYLARIRGWGYADIRARQLSHNRQEVCVAARRK